jgi:hypothetical protein
MGDGSTPKLRNAVRRIAITVSVAGFVGWAVSTLVLVTYFAGPWFPSRRQILFGLRTPPHSALFAQIANTAPFFRGIALVGVAIVLALGLGDAARRFEQSVRTGRDEVG